MNKSRSTLSLVLGLLALAGCGSREDASSGLNDANWNPYLHQPAGRTSVDGDLNFARLINSYAKAKPRKQPWNNDYWPFAKNGIANSMGGAFPAGKWDAARGGIAQQYHSDAVNWEIANHGTKAGTKWSGWEGHCNGWTAASVLYDEPNKETVVNGVTFTIADQKALLSEAAFASNAEFYGNRMESDDTRDWKWDDTIPNMYFALLTNHMGKLGDNINLDEYTGWQVWNQPIMGYEMVYPKKADELPPKDGVYRIKLTSNLWWGNESAMDSVTDKFDFDNFTWQFAKRTLQMEIWLDGPIVWGADGKITSSGNLVFARDGQKLVGGAWYDDLASTVNGSGGYTHSHPDFMWLPHSIINPYELSDEEKKAWKDSNIHIDANWILDHVIAGVNDPAVHGVPVGHPPDPEPTPRPTHAP